MSVIISKSDFDLTIEGRNIIEIKDTQEKGITSSPTLNVREPVTDIESVTDIEPDIEPVLSLELSTNSIISPSLTYSQNGVDASLAFSVRFPFLKSMTGGIKMISCCLM